MSFGKLGFPCKVVSDEDNIAILLSDEVECIEDGSFALAVSICGYNKVGYSEVPPLDSKLVLLRNSPRLSIRSSSDWTFGLMRCNAFGYSEGLNLSWQSC